jgi:uncharacterized protein YgiM (DUF1202 family)
MKTIIAFLILLFTSIGMFAQTNSQTEQAKATVIYDQGLYIFILSKPTAQYDYLGTVTKSVWGTFSGWPREMYTKLIKKTKKKYPEANGIIISDITMRKADVIKFKK